jgi:hypothetical protein
MSRAEDALAREFDAQRPRPPATVASPARPVRRAATRSG